MSSKVSYICDHCGKEIAENAKNACIGIKFVFNSDTEIKSTDLCGECAKRLEQTIHEFTTANTNYVDEKTKDRESLNNAEHVSCDSFDSCCNKCNGTLERDECTCSGNKFNCDFYSYVRVDAAIEKYKVLPEEYKCSYWSPHRSVGSGYEICNNSMENDIVKCHGDKRNCQFSSIRENAKNKDEFVSTVKDFIK